VAALSHLGSAAQGEHLQLLIPGVDPVSRWLAADLERALALAAGEGRRTLIADLASGPLRERHLARALAELPAEVEWLRRVFGEDTLARLERAGMIELERSVEPRGEPPALCPVARAQLVARGRGSRPSVLTGDTIGDDPVRVIDRATGTAIRSLDPGRAPLVAYPGAVLLWRGRRFAVALERASYVAGSEVAADLHGEDVYTQRVRSIHVSVLEPELLRPMSLGGAALRGGLTAVRVEETIHGVRRHRGDGALAGRASFEPIVARYGSLAQVLFVGKEVSEPALQALANLLRHCLAAVIDCGEEGLEVATSLRLEGFGLSAAASSTRGPESSGELAEEGPVLLLIDTYEGGAGYARAADSRALRDALGIAARVLGQGCCGAGCPRCVRTTSCYVEDPEGQTLDRAGAQAVVARLLGGEA
jgi:ATP-dependent helicase YprA (DUF1998 family)